MKKQLWMIFGPIFCAIVAIAILFLSPFFTRTQNDTVWKEASSSMAANVLRGNSIKNAAIGSGEYIPFFGSSELSRIDSFHPSALAKAYDRGYTPFLLGAPGTQSLTQFMMIQSMKDELKGKPVVFIISPQWFVRDGMKDDYFNAYFSELQAYEWALSLTNVTPSDRYVATRLLSYAKVQKNQAFMNSLAQIEQGKLPSGFSRTRLALETRILSREDQLFSRFGLLSKQKKIDQAAQKLPKTYDYHELEKLATKQGKKSTSNNTFEIDNQFYQQRVKKNLKRLKGSQKGYNYLSSPEYGDFQLVLNQLAEIQAKPLFIIPPVNEKWQAYTGLSPKMLNGFSKKINYQLKEQGFEHVVDFTQEARIPYFMADTIHLGWRGWLESDRYIEPFLTNPQQEATYHLSDEFYSNDWQKLKPERLPDPTKKQ